MLLHHVFGEVNGKPGAWGHAIGGMGAITQAMARACAGAGVEIRLEAPVAQVLVDGGKAAGVRLESGEEIAAPVVAANVGPELLFGKLVDGADLDPISAGAWRLQDRIGHLPDECRAERAARLHRAPRQGRGEHHGAGIVIAPALDYMDRAFDRRETHGWSRAPIVEMLIPSTLDDSLAPAGAHVASLFCQQFAPDLPDGRSAGTRRARTRRTA